MCIKIELLLQKGFHSIDRWFMNECEKHQLFLYCAKNFDDELVLEKQDLDFNLSFTSRNLQNTTKKYIDGCLCNVAVKFIYSEKATKFC